MALSRHHLHLSLLAAAAWCTAGLSFVTEAAASAFLCGATPPCTRELVRTLGAGTDPTSDTFGLFEPIAPTVSTGREAGGSGTSDLSANQLTVSVPLPGSLPFTASCSGCNNVSSTVLFRFAIPIEVTESTRVVWSTSDFQIGSFVTSNPGTNHRPSLVLELKLFRNPVTHVLLQQVHSSGDPLPATAGEFVLEPGGGAWTLRGEIHASAPQNLSGSDNLEKISDVAGSMSVSLVPVSEPAPTVPTMGIVASAVLTMIVLAVGAIRLMGLGLLGLAASGRSRR